MKRLRRCAARMTVTGAALALSAGCAHTQPLRASSVRQAVPAAPTRPAPPALRPPAVPLVTSDPYLSIWSEADRLTDDVTRHWTHQPHPLVSLIRVDGKSYRLMGSDPAAVPALPQTGVRVTPTSSVYDFQNAQVHVTLTFLTAALPDDLDVLTRPLTYLTWDVRSVDGQAHDAALYDSTSALLAVNTPDQAVVWGRQRAGALTALRVGTQAQTLLRPAGDDVRIDWGYAYAAAPAAQSASAIGGNAGLLAGFTQRGTLPAQDDPARPRAASENTPVLAFVFPLGHVGAAPVSRHLIVAYDEIDAVKLSSRNLRPYWRRNGATAATLLKQAERDYPGLTRRCARFDADLMSDLARVGGARYAQVCALAYRQSLASTGIAADANGRPLMFIKENTSNGDIATADVLFPTSPIWLLLSPTLAKASAVPILAYAASPVWKFPNSPHDLGTYPFASATGDPGEAMPVEESGNMLLLCDGIAQADRSADFVKPYWPQLTRWAGYLERYGLDPGDQLCTDDFMGHLAHNSNLSIKAILALAAYGDLCRMRGDAANARRYAGIAQADARHWVQVADRGPASLLAFDRPGTWSQKYNLVWDKILGLHVFPPSVARKEVAFYKGKLGTYGVPLDSRTRLGDTDHSFFSATLADTQADFETLTTPFFSYLNATTARLPMVDTYQTDDARSDGMHARSVVGGVFIRMLADRAVWRRWAGADPVRVSGWAPLPPSPTITEVVPTSRRQPQTWRYTTHRPAAGWTQPGFDDGGWEQGRGGFGTVGTPSVAVGTTWNTPDIWLRRTFVMPAGGHRNLQVFAFHDEDIEVYFNGVPAAQETGWVTAYQPIEITPRALALLKPGSRITMTAHCHQTTGGQGIDVGLADVTQP
jgi:hypothetical protein